MKTKVKESLTHHRPPVVTVMGHIDHGKTTLLDAIRKTKIAELEPGQITQHIGAYKISTPKGEIIFLDTPGHEAFTAMRARGAKVTDIVVLVVAADDGIMPQTVEAINHAKAANVPIIVAINKIDLPNANPHKIRQQLTNYGLTPEEWGGNTFVEEVSAKKKINIEKLLDTILFQAELMELRTMYNTPAEGVIIESRFDSKRGHVATILLQKGKLKIGDNFVAGNIYGKVRAIIDDMGRRLTKVETVSPVEVLGLENSPLPGDKFLVVKSEKEARKIIEGRSVEKKLVSRETLSLDDIGKEKQKKLNIILKADVYGSLEAILDSINKIPNEEFSINILHSGVGAITESDINLAILTDSKIFAFNVKPLPQAEMLAQKKGIEIMSYRIIFELTDDIKKAAEGLILPKVKENILGKAEVKKVFKVSKIGNIAGCFIFQGKVEINKKARIVRDNVIVYNGNISSLKRFKDDVKDVQEGFECGIGLLNFQDIKKGDIIEIYSIEEIKK